MLVVKIHGELVAVQHLEKLEHLDVSFCEMDEDDFKAVSSLTNLKLLRMKGEGGSSLGGHIQAS